MSALSISHSRNEETLEAKALWFQSLTLEERMDYLCFITDLVLQNDPEMLRAKDVEPIVGRVRVLTLSPPTWQPGDKYIWTMFVS
jgi:hypothetical protein